MIFGGLSALALIAFLVFATTGIVWLALSLLQGDPELARRRAGVIAITSGAVLIAIIVAGLIFRPAVRGFDGAGFGPQPGGPQQFGPPRQMPFPRFPPRQPGGQPGQPPQPTPSTTR